jgi:hypothetical protein
MIQINDAEGFGDYVGEIKLTIFLVHVFAYTHIRLLEAGASGKLFFEIVEMEI